MNPFDLKMGGVGSVDNRPAAEREQPDADAVPPIIDAEPEPPKESETETW